MRAEHAREQLRSLDDLRRAGTITPDEFESEKKARKCHSSAVITSGTFTAPARELTARIGCRLVEGDEIAAVIRGTRILEKS